MNHYEHCPLLLVIERKLTNKRNDATKEFSQAWLHQTEDAERYRQAELKKSEAENRLLQFKEGMSHYSVQ